MCWHNSHNIVDLATLSYALTIIKISYVMTDFVLDTGKRFWG
jgi:hypothetical protein